MIMDDLTKKIIGCAFEVHNVLGNGFLEKVYENALIEELTANNISVERQKAIIVRYKGRIVGSYIADMLVENSVLCELKAVTTLSKLHEVQLVNYLNATGIETGLLINFCDSVQVKRKFRIYENKSCKSC